MSDTDKNLKDAFAGESQACQKYLAFARQAEKDGFANVGKLFRTAAQAETTHAAGHFSAMNGVGSTAQNIQAAIDGETYEFTTMYPPMLKEAEAAKHKARVMFGFAMKAEAIHAKLYQAALDAVKSGKDLQATFFLCPVCGHIEMNQAPEKCPICGAKREKFVQV